MPRWLSDTVDNLIARDLPLGWRIAWIVLYLAAGAGLAWVASWLFRRPD